MPVHLPSLRPYINGTLCVLLFVKEIPCHYLYSSDTVVMDPAAMERELRRLWAEKMEARYKTTEWVYRAATYCAKMIQLNGELTIVHRCARELREELVTGRMKNQRLGQIVAETVGHRLRLECELEEVKARALRLDKERAQVEERMEAREQELARQAPGYVSPIRRSPVRVSYPFDGYVSD